MLAGYVRRCPIERCRWRARHRAGEWVRRIGPSLGCRIIHVRRGFKLQVDLQDYIGQQLYATGDYERRTTEVIEALLTQGDTFVDVGANIGYFSLLASRLVGPSGRVVAFEPASVPQARLRNNVKINRACNIDVRDVAVSERSGVFPFYEAPAHNQGLSSLRELKDRTRVTYVHVGRLDDLLTEVALPTLVKIDVEGAELQVINGARELLARERPDVIVEVTASFLNAQGLSTSQLAAPLLATGYAMYAIADDALTPIRPTDADLPDQFNALFTVRRHLPPVLAARVPPPLTPPATWRTEL